MKKLIGMVLALACVAGPALAQEKVRFAVGGKSAVFYLPLSVTERLGYFKDAGLDVEIADVASGGRTLQAIIGGSAEIGIGTFDHTIQMQAKGQPMQSIVLFGRYPQNILGIAKANAATYRSPADLKGQKIGITGPGSATQTFLNLILEKAGLKPDDVSPVTVGAGAVAVAAMKRGNELYAISNLDLAITELTLSGDIVVAIDSRTAEGTRAVYGGEYASGSLYAPMAFVQRNPKNIGAIALAMVRTLAWMKKATADEIVAKLPADFYQANPAVYRKALESNLPSFSPDGLMPPDAPANVLRAMTRFDPAIASAKIDMGTTHDNRFVEAALKAVK